MHRQIKKWAIRLMATSLLIAGLLLIIVLNPTLTYPQQTAQKNLTVFHSINPDPAILPILDEATRLVKASELYNPYLHLDICLNDGSGYAKLIQSIRGQAFAWGFYNKVVLQGMANYRENYVELHGYKWNLTQLLAHEMTHCLQFEHFGFWNSNPVVNIPNWKWEGYAEYISRQNMDQKDLSKNIGRFIAADKSNWEIMFSDGTMAPGVYYEYWILVRYCMDIKKMSFKQILADTTSEQTVKQEMMKWYRRNNDK